ncbi:hypothetical protein A3J56_03045 [Candidatus Giovannonibacteria bacterium RIFCSPHIGHO2_02_FULL_46_20]|uniref:SET domain-containing protein n=1 Tax=Candidatus Giovannonibacteria bacterium RIFCSPHIGHO2_02_FULL_46_20 TaxID=1798338 RepID=A0A1F5WGY4_9BACT|nr:MAG: hypothetical protein A3J56_03045 [Candidatus Giovannonibacteria bacterium RIFCSPHIGHO2_02_FULL_46_20]
MLLIKTKIGPSSIHGIGLFADQFIAKGTPIWEFTEGFDIKVSEKDLEKLSKHAREWFYQSAYLNPQSNQYVLCCDNARFYNHSENHNTSCVDSQEEEGTDVAAKDIQMGEELTIDYLTFDAKSLTEI